MSDRTDGPTRSRIGWPAVVAIVAATLFAGGLLGALLASGDDADDEPAPTVRATRAGDGAATTTAVIDDAPLTPAEARRVGAAATAAAGGGTAVEIDRSDDPGEAYEVEVMTAHGEVDVALDDNLRRVENLPYDD